MLKTGPGLCDITIQDPSTWLLKINDQRKCTILAKEGEVLDSANTKFCGVKLKHSAAGTGKKKTFDLGGRQDFKICTVTNNVNHRTEQQKKETR